MQNIEIKTPLDDLEAMAERAEAIGARRVWTRRQTDTFFHVPHGYLKLREVEDRPAQLIAYRRAPGREPRPSDYDIAVVPEGATLSKVLRRSLTVRGVVAKERRLFLWRHTRIHLDAVEGLGAFLELETVIRDITPEDARSEAETVIEGLGLERSRFLDRPYLELLEEAARP